MLGPRKQRCEVCKKWFKPSPFASRQYICFRVKCWNIKQKERLKRWKKDNPNYFRGDLFQKGYNIKKYIQKWRRENRKKYNAYMKKYMRQIRKVK
ncbi:MAG: hypothetical protein ABH873_09935 [Candidatus Firestonebacteria bacterium]